MVRQQLEIQRTMFVSSAIIVQTAWRKCSATWYVTAVRNQRAWMIITKTIRVWVGDHLRRKAALLLQTRIRRKLAYADIRRRRNLLRFVTFLQSRFRGTKGRSHYILKRIVQREARDIVDRSVGYAGRRSLHYVLVPMHAAASIQRCWRHYAALPSRLKKKLRNNLKVSRKQPARQASSRGTRQSLKGTPRSRGGTGRRGSILAKQQSMPTPQSPRMSLSRASSTNTNMSSRTSLDSRPDSRSNLDSRSSEASQRGGRRRQSITKAHGDLLARPANGTASPPADKRRLSTDSDASSRKSSDPKIDAEHEEKEEVYNDDFEDYTPPSTAASQAAPSTVYTPPSTAASQNAPSTIYTPPGTATSQNAPSTIYTPPGTASTDYTPPSSASTNYEVVPRRPSANPPSQETPRTTVHTYLQHSAGHL